jgi:hypothetical protein
MNYAQLFGIANLIALVTWAALALARFVTPLRRFVDPAASYWVPALFAAGYVWLIAPGFVGVLQHNSFGSLAGVATLFADPRNLLAAWVHILAFDLFVGGWIARKSAEENISAFIVVPILLFTFMFGPGGYLTFMLVRLAMRKGAP